MDVGKLFQLPSVSASSVNKRKWGAPPPGAVPAAVADVERVTQPAASKRTRVDDEADTEVYAVGEPDEGDDQEGGRFFGGGLTDEQERILNIMNRDATDGVESGGRAAYDVAEARHLLVQLERAIEKNQAMRLKYPDDPRRFIDSEADLDSALRALVLLTTHASVLYPVFLQQGSAVSVVNLLAHDNADMAAAAIQVLEELTDDDVIDAADDAGPAAMQALVQVLLDNQVLELLVSNLKRFHDTLPASDDAAAMENYESDRQAVYHTLSVLENLVSLRPSAADELGRATPLLAWLLTRMHRPGRVDQNQAYAAELLAILLHDSDANRAALAPIQGVDTLLQVLAPYRHADPRDAEEAEFLENTVDALCASLHVPDNRAQLLEAEGLELMMLLLRAKRQARSGALKVLDHALSDALGGAACSHFVEAGGLRALGPVLMRPIEGKGALRAQDMEHLLGIFAALLHNLDSDSLLRTRVLAKFVEQDYAKLDRLRALRAVAVERVEAAAPRLVEEQAVLAAEGIEPADLEALVYARRLESGLYTLQLLDYVLAWLAMEDDLVRTAHSPPDAKAHACAVHRSRIHARCVRSAHGPCTHSGLGRRTGGHYSRAARVPGGPFASTFVTPSGAVDRDVEAKGAASARRRRGASSRVMDGSRMRSVGARAGVEVRVRSWRCWIARKCASKSLQVASAMGDARAGAADRVGGVKWPRPLIACKRLRSVANAELWGRSMSMPYKHLNK